MFLHLVALEASIRTSDWLLMQICADPVKKLKIWKVKKGSQNADNYLVIATLKCLHKPLNIT
jgi:hypothetical protein